MLTDRRARAEALGRPLYFCSCPFWQTGQELTAAFSESCLFFSLAHRSGQEVLGRPEF